MPDKAAGVHPDNAALEEARQLHATGQLKEAEAVYRKLLEARENLDAQHGLALLYNQTGRNAAAIPILEQLLERDPGAISSRLVLARCLAAEGDLAAAISQCALACEALPDNAVVWNLAGHLQQQAGDPASSLEYLRRALRVDPAHGPALHNQGIALATLGDQKAAILAYEGALRVMPAAARVYYNYALSLQSCGREGDAMGALSRALELRPGMADARLRLLHLKLLQCAWPDLQEQTQRLVETLQKLLSRDEIGHLSLHVLNLLDVPSALHRQLARRMARGITRRAQAIAMPVGVPGPANGRIRLAYLSPDLGAHAVGSLLHDLFGHHDAARFEVCVFALRKFDDAIATAIRAGSQRFTDLSALSIEDSAREIADFSPDILVDLGGYTQGARSELLAMRLAPVQVSWLGYLNTMGASFIDYLIADEVVIPKALRNSYDEKIAYLPRCFLPFSQLADNAPVVCREDLGLPQGSFILASFNNTCKVQPAEFRAWVRILRAAPDSVLWMYDGDRQAVRENLRGAFELAGLDTSRLIFAPMLPMNEHLRRMQLADLFLDAFRYNAGATAMAAAQVGLPVLTLQGESLLGRMGASINLAMGLDQLVCNSVDAYVARAVELAGDPAKIAELRTSIKRAHNQPGGLFDSAAFAADLERLFMDLHQQHAP